MADVTMRAYAIDLGDDEASVVVWYMATGDAVKKGDVICDVAVAKTQFEIISIHEGVLTTLVEPEVPIDADTVIARIE
jgi:pyruvate/2-oxoglutarate dehydrogenase complex dihydrolipoamide acyltransferase (E2) component